MITTILIVTVCISGIILLILRVVKVKNSLGIMVLVIALATFLISGDLLVTKLYYYLTCNIPLN